MYVKGNNINALHKSRFFVSFYYCLVRRPSLAVFPFVGGFVGGWTFGTLTGGFIIWGCWN